MSKYDNSKKTSFIKDLCDLPSLDDKDNDLTIRSKFNLSYFDASQEEGQDFCEWSDSQLHDLLNKLKDFTTNSLDYWRNRRAGGGGLKVLAIYGSFPLKSSFKKPKHVPHQANWGRFRLGNKVRLIGFTIPPEYHNTIHKKTGELFDKNTFYVVFLDQDHKFYLTEED